ncbi:MAG: endonuclease MutS2 [Bacteroidetes bacterium]|nr:endonuclease MutS2 [Bacteroidota bacterium]
MDLTELKIKLEFGRITDSIKHHAYSALGENLCDEIIFFTDNEVLNTELDKVVEMKNILSAGNELPLDGLKDISRSLSKIKIEGYYISPEEFLHILDFLKISRNLKKFISDINREQDNSFELINGLAKNLFFNKILEHNIEITIDETGNVRDNASAALSKIRKSINAQSGRLRKTLSSILKKVSEKEFLREDIITQREGRFVIPVKAENKRNVPGIIHGSSGTGATVFIEPSEIINLNNEITELHFEEKREIEKILRQLSAQLGQYTEEIRNNLNILSEIDFIQAKARYAVETESSKPVTGSSYINLIKAYHPGLLKTKKRNEVIPLNLTIGKEFNTLVISGPNAGGKTVVLKTVGLLQLMLQSGMLVPAAPESEFRLFRDIFISIGDEQSLESDLSTFSSHLRSIKEILDRSDNNSLILIDEIASGTDPVLGSALSASILKTFSKRDAYTIVTTHNSELKEFAYSTENIENASLEFDVENLTPNFHFVTGVPGQSFTFEIARKYNFPETVLKDAYGNLDENQSRLEDLLKDLNETKQKYDLLKNKFDIDNSRLKGLTAMYEKKTKELSRNEKEIRYKAKLEAEKIIKDANKLIEKTIKEIKEDKHTPKEIKNEFRSESEKIINISEEEKIADEEETKILYEEIKVNDTVRIKDSIATGDVMEISDDHISVNINGILMKLKLNDVEKISKKETSTGYSGISNVEINEGKIEYELDLRGNYPAEIEDKIEKFIYDSVNSGLKEVSIIHGKGSGRLRTEVQKLLKKNNAVKSFRQGNWNEGDSGVTILEL